MPFGPSKFLSPSIKQNNKFAMNIAYKNATECEKIILFRDILLKIEFSINYEMTKVNTTSYYFLNCS